MRKLSPFHLKSWIEAHRDLLKPPVGNQLLWEDTELIVMIVGGPNARKDYHVDEGEEFFFQLEGDIVLKVIEEGEFKEIPIQEGDVFLLPPCVPHSPQRPANTVGLVLERQRKQGELDGFQWYCEHCGNKLYEEFFQLTHIVTQLPPLFERFYENEAHSTCQKCGIRMNPK